MKWRRRRDLKSEVARLREELAEARAITDEVRAEVQSEADAAWTRCYDAEAALRRLTEVVLVAVDIASKELGVPPDGTSVGVEQDPARVLADPLGATEGDDDLIASVIDIRRVTA